MVCRLQWDLMQTRGGRIMEQRLGCIHQPPWIPWLGVLETMLATTDVNTHPVAFVCYTDVAYKKGDYLNRNRILTPQGVHWLSIPVEASIHHNVRDIKVAENFRPQAMIKTLEQSYSKTPFFEKYIPSIRQILTQPHHYLIDFNMHMLRWMRDTFNANCEFIDSNTLNIPMLGRTKRLTAVCEHLKINVYYSGTGTKEYVDYKQFEDKKIQIVFHDYQHRHINYPQVNNKGDFIPNLSFLDALFNIGSEKLRAELIQSAQTKLQEYNISL